MINSIITLTVLISISAYLIKRNELYFIAFIVLLKFSLKIILFKTSPDIAFASGTFINILLVLLFLCLIIKYKIDILSNRYYSYYLSFILVFFFYLTILALSRDINPIIYWHFFRNFFFNIIIILTFLTIKNKKTNFSFFNLFFAILLIESFIGLLQYAIFSVSDFFKIIEYVRHGELIVKIGETFQSSKLVTGTLLSMANFGSVLVVIILFLFGIWINKVYRPTNKLYIIALVPCIVPALLTGTRVSFISLIIGLFILIWFKNKKTALILGILFFSLIYIYIDNLSPTIEKAVVRQVSIENPLERLAGTFAFFDKSVATDLGYLSAQRTIDLSNDIWINPLFGLGKNYFFGQYDSVTDAFLILLILEFGLVGLILLLLPYFYTLKLVKKFAGKNSYRIMLTIFFVLLMQTVVNEGLFYSVSNMLFFAFSGVIIMHSKLKRKLRTNYNENFNVYHKSKIF